MKCVNIGCGKTPVADWTNYDNSMSIRVARIPGAAFVMRRLRLLDHRQLDFVSFAKRSDIRFANACRRIPEPDHSVDVLYSSHMLEHLSESGARTFLSQARRVLKHGGHIRIVVPDLRYWLDDYYCRGGSADAFMRETGLTRHPPSTLRSRVKFLFVGDRSHQYMYDEDSLCRLLTQSGFRSARNVAAGETTIPCTGQLNLSERSPGSVYAEAVNP